MNKIFYKTRKDNSLVEEKVLGFGLIKFLYEKAYAKSLLKLITGNNLVSALYGWLMSTKYSRKYIAKFVKEYEINIAESKKTIGEFKSFNDFFTRELKDGSRYINPTDNVITSPADGKILVYQKHEDTMTFNLKGINYNLNKLLQNKDLTQKYENCSIAIIRLAPTDYHRFHFPYEGYVGETKLVKGSYYSVSPLALRINPNIFIENKRTICEVENEHLDSYLYMEIGATMVGSIKQTHLPHSHVLKGDTKGYFEFGGSTVILLFRSGKIVFDKDLVENTKEGYETQIKVGESIGIAL
jgi:phosphatidylserine decarboxylase